MQESLPERQEATETPHGDIDTRGSHIQELIYHEDTGTGKHHSRVLLLASQSQGAYLPTNQLAAVLLPPHAKQPTTWRPSPRTPWAMQQAIPGTSFTRQWPTTFPCSRDWQPTKLGTSSAYKHAHVVDPATTEGSMQPMQGAPLEHAALVTSGECAAGPPKILLYKATSPRLGNVTNLSNTQKIKQRIR